MTLELHKDRPFGLGLSVQNWPKARHYILRCGRRESRVIVRVDARVSLIAVAAFLVSGLIATLKSWQ